MIPGVQACLDQIQIQGGDKVTIGMPYRGRVAMLASVLNKPLEAIYSECEGIPPKLANGQKYTGDVMYHLGTGYTEKYPNG